MQTSYLPCLPRPSHNMSVIKLITVNTVPERAKRIIGRIIEEVKDQYTIIHAANVERIDDVETTLMREQPNVLFTASMWTPEEASIIVNIARQTIPEIKTLSLPHGLQVEQGPDGVVKYIKEKLPGLVV
ncbi:hypothetical protein SCP_1602960 [Sparassis crispa]|uniref:Uncharacterized protein n=1 Tax=Sparassis crispa TaxID=139825 RepID=A0A401H5E0_9APHY|nr:hypothetical protein SCP_1602960 [Sparassis crispa]GBE89632.1 hypothetical protein SCP_1602960 [Sparassis crispa]